MVQKAIKHLYSCARKAVIDNCDNLFDKMFRIGAEGEVQVFVLIHDRSIDGMNYMQSHWWISTMPALMIFWTVLGFNLLGDALRDAFDIKTR